MNTMLQKTMIEEILETIEIPDSAYDKAESRYKDLAEWFGRAESRCAKFDPHIYTQGSFRLGTVVRPIDDDDDYDLDFGCRLRMSISTSSSTQKQLKTLVGADLEDYRNARRIENKLEEKHRCWRLKYADDLSFHMDIVPSIPAEMQRRRLVKEAMIITGSGESLAQKVTDLAGSITDNQVRNYDIIDPDWPISNSEGFALWFESRMKQAQELMEKRAMEIKAATIDDIPARRWKSPLQLCVRILKQHRNLRYKGNHDSKPISAIITTLAARAYDGEVDIYQALQNILSKMGGLISPQTPRVPNPVNPKDEDFADKWATREGLLLRLEDNFWQWLKWVKEDFDILGASDNPQYLAEQALAKFGAHLDTRKLSDRIANANTAARKAGIASETPKRPVDHRGGGRFGK